MTRENSRSAFVPLLLVGALLVAIAITVCLMPLGICPNCEGKKTVNWYLNEGWLMEHPGDRRPGFGTENLMIARCARCAESGSVTLLDQWLWEKAKRPPSRLDPPLEEPRDLDPSKPIKR